MNQKLLYIIFLIFFSSCDIVSDQESVNIAKYNDNYLSKKEFLKMMEGVKKEDSLLRANYIINDWAIDKILTERAELNLNEAKLQMIDSLVIEYKSTLLSEAYLEALVNSRINLEIDTIEIQAFYNKNMGLFKLNEDIFRMVYIELPLDFSDTYQIRSKIRRFKPEDKFFLDSIAYRFKNFSLKNENWITEKELREQFPFINNYSYKSLKNYNFFQFKDSLSLYLIKIIESVKNGDISPIDHVLPTLEYMSLNKRKKELMLSIKSEILRDALQNKKLEIF
jgi:hypothetical protein|tara:strand:- start:418 stop:1257 length:840 start_codon:yes stop_codon:yes gene_type:complete